MKGEFDDHLSWPLEGTLTLQQPFDKKMTLKGSKPQETKDQVEIISRFSSHTYSKRWDFTLHVRVSEVNLRL